MENNEPKYCINCKHFIGPNSCYYFAERNLVSGQLTVNVMSADAMRYDPNLCGVEGKYFEQKENK